MAKTPQSKLDANAKYNEGNSQHAFRTVNAHEEELLQKAIKQHGGLKNLVMSAAKKGK